MIDDGPADIAVEEKREADAKRARQRAETQSQADLKSLLETEWGGRLWLNRFVGRDLFAAHVAEGDLPLRNRAAQEWAEAVSLFPELVIRAMAKAYGRATDAS